MQIKMMQLRFFLSCKDFMPNQLGRHAQTDTKAFTDSIKKRTVLFSRQLRLIFCDFDVVD